MVWSPCTVGYAVESVTMPNGTNPFFFTKSVLDAGTSDGALPDAH
jgi:hypothetical protein